MGMSSKWAGVAIAAAMIAGPSAAADKRPVVVELFTSQGCSSCPPANANLIELAKRDDVLALSFAVTYWDYLGWKDSFGKPEFTLRQQVYEPALGERGPFTPQMVVQGAASTVGFRLGEVGELLQAARPDAGPDVTIGKKTVSVGEGMAPEGGADVWIVRYAPGIVTVPVERGENRGATLPHANVVHELELLGVWNGNAATLDIPSAQGGLKTAVLIQRRNGGPILTAATD